MMNIRSRFIFISEDTDTLEYFKGKFQELGFELEQAPDLEAAQAAFEKQKFEVVIVDFNRGPDEAHRLINDLRKFFPQSVLIAFIEKKRLEDVKELSGLGIIDFISRPIFSDKLNFIIQKCAYLYSLLYSQEKSTVGLKERNNILEKQNILLAKRLEDSARTMTKLYEDLRFTYMRTIKVLAQAIDAKDHYTHSHSKNVARYGVAIAEAMRLPVRYIDTIRDACELHDLGKIGVNDSILLKPSSLTEKEWIQVKKHPVTGAQILEPLVFLSDVVEIIRQHHEHYDGGGYPDGRKGEDILLGARIIHLADAYDTMRSARSYRVNPMTKEEALMEIKRKSGTQFDPKVVAAFLQIVDSLEKE